MAKIAGYNGRSIPRALTHATPLPSRPNLMARHAVLAATAPQASHARGSVGGTRFGTAAAAVVALLALRCGGSNEGVPKPGDVKDTSGEVTNLDATDTVDSSDLFVPTDTADTADAVVPQDTPDTADTGVEDVEVASDIPPTGDGPVVAEDVDMCAALGLDCSETADADAVSPEDVENDAILDDILGDADAVGETAVPDGEDGVVPPEDGGVDTGPIVTPGTGLALSTNPSASSCLAAWQTEEAQSPGIMAAVSLCASLVGMDNGVTTLDAKQLEALSALLESSPILGPDAFVASAAAFFVGEKVDADSGLTVPDFDAPRSFTANAAVTSGTSEPEALNGVTLSFVPETNLAGVYQVWVAKQGPKVLGRIMVNWWTGQVSIKASAHLEFEDAAFDCDWVFEAPFDAAAGAVKNCATPQP